MKPWMDVSGRYTATHFVLHESQTQSSLQRLNTVLRYSLGYVCPDVVTINGITVTLHYCL